MVSQCMRFTSVSASVKTAFAFSLVWCHNACVSHACLHLLGRLSRFFFRIPSKCMRFTCVCASVKTAFAFSLVWRQRTCVSQASLHIFRRLLRCSSFRVTMHSFHTRVCIGKTTSAFSLIWHYNACVSHARLHRFSRLSSYCVTNTCVSHACLRRLNFFFVFLCMASKNMCFPCVFASVKTGFAFSLVLRHSSCISNACLHRLRQLLRFPSYGVIMHTFHTLVFIF